MTLKDLVLDSRYRLLRRLATGGMGEVWEGSDELLNRPVAVKMLRQEHIGDEHARARFRAEARYAAALQHGGIAQVYDYGEHDDRAYLVMELVQGEPLSRILARTGSLTPETMLDVVAQAARALQVAHSAGIIHRDVKPGNLMVTAEGAVKITDFGIARGLNVATLTQTGMVMGTAHYVSPEQASGQPITFATDLYSLGVVAFECLTGHPPFDAEQPVAIALKHVREAPPELPDEVPEAVRALVRALLAKDPEERPADARAVADEAYMIHDALLAGEPVESSFGEPQWDSSGGVFPHPFGDPFDDAFEDDGFDGPPGFGQGPGSGAYPGVPRESAPTLAVGPGTGGRRIGVSTARFELDRGDATDTLAGVKGVKSAASLPGAGSPATLAGARVSVQRRTVLVAASVATGVLLLGVIVAASVLRGPGPASADLKETRDGAPTMAPESQAPVPSQVPSPADVTDMPSWPLRRPGGNNSTASTIPTPSASSTRRPRPSPTRTDPTPEEPTPTPSGSDTPSPPSTVPPPAASSPGDGRPGSE